MENIITINAETRAEISKRVNKDLRKQEKVPAIIYGLKADSIPVSVSSSDMKKIMRSEGRENSILRIVHDGKNNLDAMVKEIQYDFLSKTIIHVDFIRIDLNKPVDVMVPIILEGDSIGTRTEEGLLDFVNREISVRCLPTNIPRMIKVDISNLHINQSIKLEDIPVGEGIQYLSSLQTVICAIGVKAQEEVKEVAPVEGEAAAPVEGEAAAAEGTPPADDKKAADKKPATDKKPAEKKAPEKKEE